MPSSSPRPTIVHALHQLAIGGLENGLVNLLNHLPEDEFDHAILCITDFDESFAQRIRRSDIEVISLNKGPGNGIKQYPRITKTLRQIKPHILHSRGPSALDTLFPGLVAGVPFRIHGEHGWDEHDPGGTNRKNQLLRRFHRPLVNQYIALSSDIETYLLDKIHVPKKRIQKIYNGVDTERFQPGDKRLVKEALQIPNFIDPDKHLIIGTVGRLQPVKAQYDLCRAIAILLQKEPALRDRVRTIIVGDGPLLNELQQQIVELGLKEIVWLSGARDDIPQMMQAMDIFALPSLAEGISNTILEAMATGLPIVASHVGGNKELVATGQNGLLHDPAQPEQIANALQIYAADDKKRNLASAASRDRAIAEFSLHKMVNEYLNVYRQALG